MNEYTLKVRDVNNAIQEKKVVLDYDRVGITEWKRINKLKNGAGKAMKIEGEKIDSIIEKARQEGRTMTEEQAQTRAMKMEFDEAINASDDAWIELARIACMLAEQEFEKIIMTSFMPILDQVKKDDPFKWTKKDEEKKADGEKK